MSCRIDRIVWEFRCLLPLSLWCRGHVRLAACGRWTVSFGTCPLDRWSLHVLIRIMPCVAALRVPLRPYGAPVLGWPVVARRGLSRTRGDLLAEDIAGATEAGRGPYSLPRSVGISPVRGVSGRSCYVWRLSVGPIARCHHGCPGDAERGCDHCAFSSLVRRHRSTPSARLWQPNLANGRRPRRYPRASFVCVS